MTGINFLTWLGLLILMAASLASGQTVVSQLPSPAVSLTSTDALHALTHTGEVWQLSTPPVRRLTGASPEAPLTSCGQHVVAVLRGGQLWWGTPTGVMGLSVTAGTLCTPDGAVLAIATDGALVRVEPNHHVSGRAQVNALQDVRPRLADLNGDGQRSAVLLSQPTTRYAHGVLGDAVEAGGLLALNPRTLAVEARLTLGAPFVFEDWEARPLRQGQRDVLAVVRSSGRGGGALTLVERRGANLSILANGPDFRQGGRWLAPITDGVSLYAVHTPHLGGVLHRYDRAGRTLTATPVPSVPLVSNHLIGARFTTGGVWRGTVWLGLQDASRTLSVPNRGRLETGPSSPLLFTPGGAFLGTQDGRVWRLP